MFKFQSITNRVSSAEHQVEPSVTIPDEAYSIQELFERYANGCMPDILRNPVFQGDDNLNFDDYDAMEDGDFDLVDAQEQLNELNDRINESRRVKMESRAKSLKGKNGDSRGVESSENSERSESGESKTS